MYILEIRKWNNGFSRKTGYPWIEQTCLYDEDRIFESTNCELNDLIRLNWFWPKYDHNKAINKNKNYKSILKISNF